MWTTVGEICSKIGSGSTPKGSNYSNTGIPFFRSQNIYNTGIVLSDIKYISEEVHQSMIGTEVAANDLLLNITGGSLGRCAIVPDNFSKGNVSQHVCILRSILVRPKYLHAFILSSFFAKSMKITGSGREGLPKYNLEKMLLPLPPLNEQDKIIGEVDKFFEFVNTLEFGEDNLTKLIMKTKSKILNLAIHGKLVSQDPNDEPAAELLKRINPKAEISWDNPRYGKLPKGWCSCRLDSLCKIKGGKRIPRGMTFSNVKTNHIYIRVSDMKQNTIITADLKYIDEEVYGMIKNYTISSSDLYLTIAGTIGKVGFVPVSFDGMNLTENAAKLTEIVCDKKYLLYSLLSTHVQEHFKSKYHQVAQPKLSIETASSAIISLPPLSEQHRIVAKIEELFTQLDKIESSL